MGGLLLPLHLSPDDMSPEAFAARIDLHQRMARLNPKGWHTPRSPVRLRSRRKIGNRDKRSGRQYFRLGSLMQFARLAGKAELLAAVTK